VLTKLILVCNYSLEPSSVLTEVENALGLWGGKNQLNGLIFLLVPDFP